MREYILFAGVNGAGKTTLYQSAVARDVRDMPRINVDEIVRGIGDWNNPQDSYDAGMKAVALWHSCFEQGISFNQETTLCGKSIIKNIYRAMDAGYSVEIYYVGVSSPAMAKERVRIRVSKGGHGIPDADIDRRFDESLRNINQLISVVNRVDLYDNSDIFTKIASFRMGKCVFRSRKQCSWAEQILQDHISR